MRRAENDMTFFGRFFGNVSRETPTTREAKRLLKEAEAHTTTVYGPLGKLGQAIVGAAWESYQRLAEYLGFSLRGTPSERQIRLFYELLFFFSHVTLRAASAGGLDSPKIKRLQSYLGPLIAGTAVDTFFRDWPEERKAGIKTEFFENLNRSELEYAECRELMVKGEPYEDRSLFGRLQHNIGELFETVNPVSLGMAKQVPVEAFMRMQLDRLISGVATVIDSVDAGALAGFGLGSLR